MKSHHADCILLHTHIHTEITQFLVPIETRKGQDFFGITHCGWSHSKKKEKRDFTSRDHFKYASAYQDLQILKKIGALN